jgi:hypothetical protein
MWSRNGAHERDAASYYAHANPPFQAGSETCTRLNEIVAVGTGYRTNIFQVL